MKLYSVNMLMDMKQKTLDFHVANSCGGFYHGPSSGLSAAKGSFPPFYQPSFKGVTFTGNLNLKFPHSMQFSPLTLMFSIGKFPISEVKPQFY